MSNETMVLRLPSPTQSVSAWHSLVRTMQVAAREAAQSSPNTAVTFASSPVPQLVFEVTDISNNELSLEFRFVEQSAEHRPHMVSEMAFGEFLEGLSNYIKSSPMRTLWGSVPVRRERPGHENSALDERMEQVLIELERIGNVELSAGERHIRFTSSGVNITP